MDLGKMVHWGCIRLGLGLYYPPIMQNQMEKQMENGNRGLGPRLGSGAEA